MGKKGKRALEACEIALEARIMAQALRGLDALDLSTIEAEDAEALQHIAMDAIAERLERIAEALEI